MVLWLPLVFVFSVWCAHAKKDDGPGIVSTKFDTPPSNLQWFDDTDIVLVQERKAGLVWRSDDAGATWDKVKGVEEGEADEVWLNPHDNKVAYILSRGKTHWVTNDQGETWSTFHTGDWSPSEFREPFSFHAGNSDKVILNTQICQGWVCEEASYYTTDGFTKLRLLRKDTRGCHFAHSTALFKTSDDDSFDDRVLCVARGRYSPRPTEHRLLVSDSFFDDEFEPLLDEDRTVQGIISMAVVKGFLVTAAKAEGTSELALYVTDDAKTWHRAEFPDDSDKLEEEAYTILESTNYSIQVDVMTTRSMNPMGVLFSSNSNGTYFTENIKHTNRDYRGIVDFEKIQNIQGIVLVNIVDNWVEVERTAMTEKNIKSRISFDDGRTFEAMTTGVNNLHLHSVTEMSNSGRVFSSSAPGLVMGVGNTGKYLKPYEEGDLYVSDDAGLTWTFAIKSAHKYEFGDQGSVLVAVYDEGPAEKIEYSINHGKKWDSKKFDKPVNAKILTTTPDSTSLKFLLLGTTGSGSKTEYSIIAIDFNGLHERDCEKNDFEEWDARIDEDGQPSCIMGHKQMYRRRKPDADCFINKEFKDPLPLFESCKCTEKDFECDYNFIQQDGKCVPATTLPKPKGACKSGDEKFIGSSGYRLIPGNECTRRGGVELDEEIERPCEDTVKTPSSGKISHTIKTFQANHFREYYYMERTPTSSGDDETIIMRTDMNEVYISRDHGKSWDVIPELEDEDIIAIVPHQYFKDAVYFLTGYSTVYYTVNRGKSFHDFFAPHPPNEDQLPVLSFHPDNQDWLMWTGAVDCGTYSDGECHSETSISEDRGDNWHTMLRYVQKCEFIKKEGRGDAEKLVYCEQFKDERLDGQLQLTSSDDWFKTRETHFDDILTFATMSEFIIVAQRDDIQNLKVDASIDGKTFAPAAFPKNFNVPVQRAYTVLDSSTHAVFLHVTVGSHEGFEYGRLMKSNSNGTNYVLSIAGVNRNGPGYVDFEKMQGLEGVAIINVVDNLDEEEKEKRKAKALRTLITHNDGAEWAPLKAPKKDADGKDFDCDIKNTQECSLHLHGYTERKDPRDTFSSASAVGLMMGVGNVGGALTRKADANTFVTRDGGSKWHEVMKGNYMWEYGDQGGIIVIVEDNVATKVVYYSLDEGENWTEYQFADSPMIIDDLTTLPSDNSLNFLLWRRGTGSGGEISTINIDFSGLRARKCILNENDPNDADSDYYLWEPKHPMQENNCLFGHVSQYHRKKLASECWNGHQIHQLHNIAENCSCTRQDFEW